MEGKDLPSEIKDKKKQLEERQKEFDSLGAKEEDRTWGVERNGEEKKFTPKEYKLDGRIGELKEQIYGFEIETKILEVLIGHSKGLLGKQIRGLVDINPSFLQKCFWGLEGKGCISILGEKDDDPLENFFQITETGKKYLGKAK